MAVFLSYHNTQLETVEHLARHLGRRGIETWYAARDIQPGANWPQAISNAIRRSEALVLLFDAAADASDEVQREVGLAALAGVPIRWLRLEDVKPLGLGYYLGTTQWIDWLDKRTEALDSLVRSLSSSAASLRPAASEDEEGAVEPGAGDVLPLYEEWVAVPLAPIGVASDHQLISGLIRILEAEGPMVAGRAFHLYHAASGGHRLGRDIERELTLALRRAVRSGQICQIKDSLRGQQRKTIYLPGTPCVVARRLGPRRIDEVPRSEIAHVAQMAGSSSLSGANAARAALVALGVRRITEQAIHAVNRSLSYTYKCQAE